MPTLAKGECRSWLLGVEDHDVKLEDTNESLNQRDQEDAANDLL